MLDKKMTIVVAVLTLLSATTALGAMGDLIVSGHGTVSAVAARYECPISAVCKGVGQPIVVNLEINPSQSGMDWAKSLGTFQLRQGNEVLDGTVDRIIETDYSTFVKFEGTLSDGRTSFSYSAVGSTTKEPNTWGLGLVIGDRIDLSVSVNGALQIQQTPALKY